MMLDESLRRRALYRRHIEGNSTQLAELVVCRDDMIHWVNQWCYTYNPREEVKSLPFDLFPKQIEFMAWLAEREKCREDGLVEKSRDMGATWLCCTFALHRWLFMPGFSAGFGSRKLELVDRIGDADSIFEKIRFLLYGLPTWMTPEGFSRNDHDNQARLVNPKNGASLTGEGGVNIGRGGRKSMYFVDEAAFLERPEMADRSLFGNTDVRIDVSTPNGPGNPFAQKRFSGKVKVFTLHWRDDPRKGEEWYAKVKAEKDAVTIAQEVDLDYTASIEGICIPAPWVRAAVGLKLTASVRVSAGLDVGEYGSDPSVFMPRAGPVVMDPSVWGRCNTTETAWRARDEAVKSKAEVVCYDAGGVGAGVRGSWETAERLPFDPHAVLFGESPSEDYWPDGATSKEKFLNLRAEMWWKLRARFEKAFEYVEKNVPHPHEEMISIPNHPQLIAELSMPLTERTETGKIKIESKDKMRARGVKSPNFADALAVSFHAEAYGPWDPKPDPSAKLEAYKAPGGVFQSETRRPGRSDDPDGDEGAEYGEAGGGIVFPSAW